MTRSCDVTTGLYTVINHSTGTRWEDINVGRSMATTTRVNFDISVPAYQSDELLVKLVRSDKEVSATWNSDELWTVADDFPINSEETIKVTFYDRNGGIVLARFEQIVSTGTAISESYAISAFQFYTDIDDDNDGVSNLDELLAGTDPLLAETRELPIRDAPFGGAWPNVLPDFESIGRIVERPYSVEKITPEGSDPFSSARSTLKRVTIDESGNGSFYYRKLLNRIDLQYIEEKIGNRTNTGHSILWDGSEYLFSESHRSSRDTHFTVEASRFDTQRLRIVATFNTEWLNEPIIGDSLHWTYDLVVTDVDDDGHCLPDSGTYVSTTTNLSESYTDSLMITKNPGDEYWHVLSTRNGVTLSEYLASWINMEVFCNYADFD